MSPELGGGGLDQVILETQIERDWVDHQLAGLAQQYRILGDAYNQWELERYEMEAALSMIEPVIRRGRMLQLRGENMRRARAAAKRERTTRTGGGSQNTFIQWMPKDVLYTGFFDAAMITVRELTPVEPYNYGLDAMAVESRHPLSPGLHNMPQSWSGPATEGQGKFAKKLRTHTVVSGRYQTFDSKEHGRYTKYVQPYFRRRRHGKLR